MTRIPTLDDLGAALVRVVRRFPAVVVVIVAIVVAAQALVDGRSEWAVRVVTAGSFAVPAFVATTLLREARSDARGLLALDGLVAVAALVFAWQWPAWTEEIGFRRLVQANLAGLLAVAVLPFVGSGHRILFWAFNRSVFVRFVVTSIFTGVLFVGLGIAVHALETLFGIDVSDDVYPRLFLVLLTLFHPLVVLAGIPDPIGSLAGDDDLPAPLRVFARSILAPLVTLYLAILLAYLARVLITQDWPQGWIGWLVSAVAAAGVLAVLLLDPVTREPRGRWVVVAARVYFVAMIPALVMLLLALGQRMAQYGVTENRYFLGALAVWMLGLSLVRTLGRASDPRWIPATLALVVLVTAIGPWSAYAVSRQSQSARLVELLDRAGRLRDGVAIADSTRVDTGTVAQVRDTIRYLVTTHGRDAIDPWFAPHAATIDGGAAPGSPANPWDQASRALDAIGLEPEPVSAATPGDHVVHAPWNDAFVELGPVTHAASVDLESEGFRSLVLDQDTTLRLVLEGATLSAVDDSAPADTLFRVDLGPQIEAVDPTGASRKTGERSPMVFPFASDGWTGSLVVTQLHAVTVDDRTEVRRLSGTLALGRR